MAIPHDDAVLERRPTMTRQEDDDLSVNEIVTLFFLLVAVLIVLILMMYQQCQQLQQTIVKRRHLQHQQQQQHNTRRSVAAASSTTTNDDDDNSLQAHRYSRRQAYQALQTELESMRELQHTVKQSQLLALQGLVEQQQRQEQPHHPGNTAPAVGTNSTELSMTLRQRKKLEKGK